MSIFQANKKIINDKARFGLLKIALLGIMGGFFIGMGFIGFFAIYQFAYLPDSDATSKILMKFFASAMFPVGLLACVFMGGSLFTSDSLLSIAWYQKQIKTNKIIINWTLIWVFNFIGSSFVALLVFATGVFDQGNMHQALLSVARSKAELVFTSEITGWLKIFASGVLCNILVAGAIFMANGVKSPGAKIALIWFPITLFVLAGFQHTVANQFVFVEAWLENMSINHWGAILNLLLSGIGNWVAGAIIIPVVYGLIDHFGGKQLPQLEVASLPKIDFIKDHKQ